MLMNEIAGTKGIDPGPATGDRTFIGAIFYGLMVAFGLYTVLYDAALLLSWSLATTIITWAVLIAIPAFAWGFSLIAELRAMRHRARDFSLFYMAGLGLVTGLVCLLVSKFNEDDSFYMSRAVLDWDNWWRPIAVNYPFAFVNGASGIFTSLPSFEHFASGIAGLAGTHPLDIYYFAEPAVIGFLLPFAWYFCLLRIGLSRHGAFVGTAFIVILMLLDGTTVRGVANFSLFRIWQGKVVLISVVTPLAIKSALDAIDDGGRGDWIELLVIGVAGIGLSTTAAFFLPVLVGVAGFAWWLTRPAMATIWRPPAAALAVFLYPAICILPIYSTVSGPGMIFAAPFAFNLTDTLNLVYGLTVSPTLIAAVAGILGLLATRRFRLLLWVAIWTAIIATPLAWPPTANLIVRYGTSSDAFWRLAYASPVILTIGLGLGACGEARWGRRASGILVAVCATGTVAAAMLQAEFSPFAAANVIFPTLHYKIPPKRLAAAQVLVRDLPAGTMLAPVSLSVILPLISSKFLLTNFLGFDAVLQLQADGHPDQADALEKAFEYVSGRRKTPDRLTAFQEVVSWRPDYVVLDSAMSDPSDAIATLTKAGYRELESGVVAYRVFRHATS